MPEGISVGDVTIEASSLTADKSWSRNHLPPADASAPRGYTWSREEKRPIPKKTGRIIYGEDADSSPPRASVAEPSSRGGEDPAPSWQQPKKHKGKLKYEDVPQNIKDDIAGLGGLIATPLLALIQQIDPYCGGALAANFTNVLDATLPIMCRSEKLVKYFSEDQADWLLWGKLAMSLAPVGQAILQHHVFRTVKVIRDEHGIAHVVPNDKSADPLQPHVPVQEYTA